MKKYILGNIRKIIYESNSGPYKVGVFKVKETNDEELNGYVNKVIGFTGSFNEVNMDVDYVLYGKIFDHPKYGIQYNVDNYEIKEPTDLDSLVLYLSSGMFKGIGLKTAKKIVERYGSDTIKVIKEDYEALENISGMTRLKAKRMHDKIVDNELNQDLIIKLNSLGFSVREAVDLMTHYNHELFDILENDVYELIKHVSFDKLDLIFLKSNDEMHPFRISALIKHNIYTMCYETGDTLIKKEELFIRMKKCFRGIFDADKYLFYLNELSKNGDIVLINEFVCLSDFYTTENMIINSITRINGIKSNIKKDKIDKLINDYEVRCDIKFNDDQKEAIKGSILNNFFIITGGPGTGKTTIIKAIVEILKDLLDVTSEDIALLAPTGRASKRMAESVLCPAYTIHKYLKWNKETESFLVDEYNKSHERIVIVDESSMIDIFLFSSLLKGLRLNVKLILVGDVNQLPSIGPGDLLNDLLNNKNVKSINEYKGISKEKKC